MGMLDKRSVKMEGVQDWDWSPCPADALLAAYQAEQEQLPARVLLQRFPSREELRQKNLFSVAGEGWGLRGLCGWCAFRRLCAAPPLPPSRAATFLCPRAGIKLTWHPQGDYLAVQVRRPARACVCCMHGCRGRPHRPPAGS